MTTRPTDIYPTDWAGSASDPSDDIVEPSASKQAEGWEFNEPVPYGWLNWFWNLVTSWLRHLASSSSRFEALENAINASVSLAAGDTFILHEDDSDDVPGTLVDSNLFSSAALGVVVGLDCTGASYVGIDLAGGASVTRDGTLIADYTPTNAGTPISVASDGDIVVIAYGQYVECYDHDTGASQWVYDHGASVHDVAISPTQVYMVGEESTSVAARAIDRAAGTSDWDYDHGNDLYSVAYAGRVILVGGLASSHGSSATFRTIEAANGKDAADEGGNGTSDYAGVLGVYDGTIGSFTGPKQIVTDGRLFAVRSDATTADKTIEVYGLLGAGGAISNTVANEIVQLAMDQDLIYAATDDLANTGEITAFAKHTMKPVWVYREPTSTEKGMGAVASDGASVLAADASAIGLTDTVRLRRGNKPAVWAITDPTTSTHAMRQLAIPGGH